MVAVEALVVQAVTHLGRTAPLVVVVREEMAAEVAQHTVCVVMLIT
jgi:hypothetical protein